MQDRDEEVLIRAEVPGVPREDLEVTLSGDTVTFSYPGEADEESDIEILDAGSDPSSRGKARADRQVERPAQPPSRR